MGARSHSHHGNRPRAFEGRASRFYNLMATTLLRRGYRRLARDIADSAPKDVAVLDVGTGPGVLLAELAGLRPDLQMVGIDLSEDMVTAAERNLAPYGSRVAAQVGDVTRIPFEDRSFDLIVSSFSLHHWDDPQAGVPELARVLRPGGKMYIYDVRSAPFELVTTTARSMSLLTGQPPRQRSIRTGIPLLPRAVKLEMSR